MKAARAFNGLARELGNAMQRYMVKEQGCRPWTGLAALKHLTGFTTD
jgi:hypothetical protein